MSLRDVGGFGKRPGSAPNIRAGWVTLAIIGVIVLLLLVVSFNSYTVINAGTRGVVKTFGEITGVFDEGLHFRTPFVTSVVEVDVKTQRLESNSSAASKDLQIVTTQVVLNYRPDPDNVATLIREIGTDYQSKIIDPAIQESVKAATARFTAEELITQRPLVSESIREVLVERLAPRNIVVQDLSITEFNFSPEFSTAIESKQVAEQETLRAQRVLERVQIEAHQRVAQAEADAKARITIAQAEAEALRLQREVISLELLQLRFIEKWDGVLPRFSSGDSGLLPLVNIPQEELQAQPPSEPAPTAAPTAPAPSPIPEPSPTPEP
jgi:regulator of protease activity HflC (stomatin/prohibitin superfamily)